MPPAVAAPAQDMINPSSPLATGVQGSAAATSQPNLAVVVEPKVEVKRESQLDAQLEDGEQGNLGATCTSSAATGNSHELVLNFSVQVF